MIGSFAPAGNRGRFLLGPSVPSDGTPRVRVIIAMVERKTASKRKSRPVRAAERYPEKHEGGILPLDFMLAVLRDADAPIEDRKWAAYHAAPFCHAKRSTVDHSGDVTIRHEDALEELA